jgi:hypothetical protein
MGIIIRKPHLTSFPWILKVLIGNSWETLHPTIIKRKKSPKPDWSWRPSNWPPEMRCHWIACLSILHHWDVYWYKQKKNPVQPLKTHHFMMVPPIFTNIWLWLQRFPNLKWLPLFGVVPLDIHHGQIVVRSLSWSHITTVLLVQSTCLVGQVTTFWIHCLSSSKWT